MELPYVPELVEEAGKEFDSLVSQIREGKFEIEKPPERKICKECDIRSLCASQRVIEPFADDE